MLGEQRRASFTYRAFNPLSLKVPADYLPHKRGSPYGTVSGPRYVARDHIAVEDLLERAAVSLPADMIAHALPPETRELAMRLLVRLARAQPDLLSSDDSALVDQVATLADDADEARRQYHARA